MQVQSDGSVLVPAGEYILGDPCYAVPDELWGEFVDAILSNSGLAVIQGKAAFAFGTAHGDGVYEGTDGAEYGVDSGLIGLVPVDFPGAKMMERFQTKLKFDGPTPCWQYGRDNGTLHFGHIAVFTSSGNEDDDEDVCDCCGRRR